MKLINVLTLFLVCFCLKQLKPNFCNAEDKYKAKTVKQIIHDTAPLMKLRNSEEEVFVLLFRKVVHDKTLSGKLVGSGEQLIAAKEPQLTDNEYFALFNEQLDQDKVNQYQYKIKHVLADSICSFYGIEREELVKIRKNKHLINKKKKEINDLFNSCLKTIQEELEKNKMIELITEKVLQKQNESLVSTVPDCPPLI